MKRFLFAVIALCLVSAGPGDQAPPPQGLTTAAKVVYIVDGDTFDAEIKLRVRVRMLDCWAPESRTRNAAEKKRGIAAKEHLRYLAEGKEITLFLPAGANNHPLDMTLERALGHAWVAGDDVSLSRRMVGAGLASRDEPAQ